MNIDEDDLSDEYDFMDEDDEGQDGRRKTRSQAQTKTPKLKYMDLLHKIADRQEEEVTIDLDDIEAVGTFLLGSLA